MFFSSYHPENNPSQVPGESNIWRLILNFPGFFLYTESTHTYTQTYMYSPKQAKQEQWRKKNYVLRLCVLIFSLGKYDSFRHFLLAAPRNVFRVQSHKLHLILKSMFRPFSLPLADEMRQHCSLLVWPPACVRYTSFSFFPLPEKDAESSFRPFRFLVWAWSSAEVGRIPEPVKGVFVIYF